MGFKAGAAEKKSVQFNGPVMLYRIRINTFSMGNDGPVTDVSEVMAAIERSGWRIEQVVYDTRQNSNGSLLLFCRRVQPEPQVQPQVQPGYAQQPYEGPWPPR